MHKVCPFQEPSATLVMFVMVEHTLEHPMMALQEDHVPKGHFVWRVPLNLILVVLEHTVRALVEQVTRIVSRVILATSVHGSSLQPRKEHVMLGITVQRNPSYLIRQLLLLGTSLQQDLQSPSLVYLGHINHMRSKVIVFHVNQDFTVIPRT